MQCISKYWFLPKFTLLNSNIREGATLSTRLHSINFDLLQTWKKWRCWQSRIEQNSADCRKFCRISNIVHTESFKWAYILRRSENSILTLMIIFRVKINVDIYIEPRNGVKIFKKWVLGMSIFTQNLTRPPLRRKTNILKYRVYCIQKNRLCNTVSTKQSVN